MRLFNAVLGGLITGFLLYLLTSLASLKSALIIFLISWVVFAYLFYRGADSVKEIWARTCLVAAVECIIIPLASWFLPFFYGEQAVSTARQGVTAAGQSFGSTLGGGLVNILAGYTGLLIGFLLLATAYFSLKPARRKR